MKKKIVLILAGLAVATAGCCGNVGVFGQVDASLKAVQAFYDPLEAALKINPYDDQVRMAVVAADTALLLAGELQKQWCPAAAKAEQLKLQAAEAAAFAAAAGVI
jgi:hypothetical protein